MKKAKTNRIITAVAGLALLAATAGGCSRPTKHESTYKTNLENEISWQGVGPGMRWHGPFHSIDKISHRRQVMNFPLQQAPADSQLTGRGQLALETEQCIVTAKEKGQEINEIMIQEIIIAYNLVPSEEAVRSYFVDHREEDRPWLDQNLEGVVRTYLQTKPRSFIEANQDTLGNDIKRYIGTFRAGGIPQFEGGELVGFKGSYSIEEEWGIEITEVTARRIRPPSYVLSAIPEGEAIVKKAQGEFESAQADADRRRSKLNSLQNIVDNIGDNDAAAIYLNAQTVAEMVENLGSKNIGSLRIVQGLGGGEQQGDYVMSRAK